MGGRREAVVSRWRAAATWVVAVLALWLWVAGPARATATIAVNTTADETSTGNGTCSLHEAVLFADGMAESDCAPGMATGTTTIVIPAGHFILDIAGTLTLSRTTVLDGAGGGSTIIDATGHGQVFSIQASADVTINAMTITGGASGLTPCPQPVTVSCELARANGLPGGGLANAGTLALNDDVITGNLASAGSRDSGLGTSAAPGGAGGGIANSGMLTITDSSITQNTTGGQPGSDNPIPGSGAPGGDGGASGAGGGLDNSGTLIITGSTISGNSTGPGGDGGDGAPGTSTVMEGSGGHGAAAGGGGGIENTGSLTITASTISGNATGVGGNSGNGGMVAGGSSGGGTSVFFGGSSGPGGGIDTSTAITVQNSTIAGNTTGGVGHQGIPSGGQSVTGSPGVPGPGGGLNQAAAGATLTHDTIAGNTAVGAGGGLNAGGGAVIAAGNSIVASNRSGALLVNCNGPIVPTGNDIVFGDNTCGVPQGGDPRLGPLAANGGPTQTMALLAGSSAINVVSANNCPLSTDERGAARPQGSGCDAGAYEVAPPALASAAAAAAGTTQGVVTAAIGPNLRDTTVVVLYGTTSAFGSATPAQDVGAGNAPVAFSARLTGLAPGRTYHAEIVASNADGTTTGGELTFITRPAVGAAFGRRIGHGDVLLATITCGAGNPGDVCRGPVTLTAHQTTEGKKVVAVSAVAAKPKAGTGKGKGKKPKRTTARVTLTKAKYSIPTGHSKTLKLTLNAAGRRLLDRFYTLPATLSIAGTTNRSQKVVFRFGRLHISPVFTWSFSATFTSAQQLTVGPLPAHAKVAVLCRGGGCPFSRRTLTSKRRKLDLEPLLKGKRLRPGAALALQITAPDDVGEVVTFTMNRGSAPTERFSCLLPGRRSPTACAA
jgi:hypothetical protein